MRGDGLPGNSDRAIGRRDEPPFFIVGCQRSGTTMLRLMLNAHPRLGIPFESHFIPQFSRLIDRYGDLRARDNLARLLDDISNHRFVERGGLIQDHEAVLDASEPSYAGLVDAIFSHAVARSGKARWGDKTPQYVTEIDVLRDLFPDCKVIHVVRDGRDVALSLRNVSWGSACLPRVARDWAWKATLAHKMGALLEGDYLEVRYEDLVLEPQASLRHICSFLGEDYDDSLLDYHQDAREEMPERSMEWHQNSVRSPDADKVFEWQRSMSLGDQLVFQDVAGSTLEVFGYELVDRDARWRRRLRHLYYVFVKRW